MKPVDAVTLGLIAAFWVGCVVWGAGAEEQEDLFVGERQLTEEEMERIKDHQTPEAKRIGGLTPAQQQEEWEGAFERDPNTTEVDEGATLLERLFGTDEGEGQERESLEGVYR